jgi:hypothetical protein
VQIGFKQTQASRNETPLIIEYKWHASRTNNLRAKCLAAGIYIRMGKSNKRGNKMSTQDPLFEIDGIIQAVTATIVYDARSVKLCNKMIDVGDEVVDLFR